MAEGPEPPDSVTPLKVVIVGDGYKIEPDKIIDKARGCYIEIVVVGRTATGEVILQMSHGRGESLLLLETAKRRIVTD